MAALLCHSNIVSIPASGTPLRVDARVTRLFCSCTWKDLSVGIQTRYQSKQLLRFVEIQDLADYGNVIQQDKSYVTNLTFNYAASENVDVYGGVNNITNEKPFITNYAYPASIRGRFAFFGMNYRM
ncbi:MAG: iron complex outermembrane receptor protein [bacterium]